MVPDVCIFCFGCRWAVYTYDFPMARREIMLEHRKTRPGQEALKEQALEMIDKLLAEQNRQKRGLSEISCLEVMPQF